jgi:hypothetical protein
MFSRNLNIASKASLHRLYLTYCTQVTQLYIYKAVFPQKIIRVGKCMKIYSLEYVNTHNFSWWSPILLISLKKSENL